MGSEKSPGSNPDINGRVEYINYGDGGADVAIWHPDASLTVLETNADTGEHIGTQVYKSGETEQYTQKLTDWRQRQKPIEVSQDEDSISVQNGTMKVAPIEPDTSPDNVTAKPLPEEDQQQQGDSASGSTINDTQSRSQPEPTLVPNPNAPASPESLARVRAIIGDENDSSTETSNADVEEEERQRRAENNTPNNPEDEVTLVGLLDEAREEERQRKLQESIKQIEDEVNGGEYGETYRTALAKYAELKATSETVGNRWIGRSKREDALKEAEYALVKAKLQIELAKAHKKREASLYEGDEDTITAQCKNDVFNGIRTIDELSRKATNEVLERRENDRGLLMKASATVGKWLLKGNKFVQGSKGAGLGALTAFGVAFSGLGIPVTILGAGGISLGLRHAANTAALDTIRAENKDADGNAVRALSDEKFAEFMDSLAGSDKHDNTKAMELGNKIMETSRERGYDQVRRSRKQKVALMSGFAVGSALGGSAGHLLHGAYTHVSGARQAAAAVKDKAAEKVVHTPSRIADIKLTDIPQNAGHVNMNEGFYRFFGQYGMTPDQAHQLLADHHVMDQLVQTHDAYHSADPLVGPYGLRLPASGHISDAGQRVIEAAMKARGYNTATLHLGGMNYV